MKTLKDKKSLSGNADYYEKDVAQAIKRFKKRFSDGRLYVKCDINLGIKEEFGDFEEKK